MAQSTAGITDTIAAISTALGEGGIAIIRISGAGAVHIARCILSRKILDVPGMMYLTNLHDDSGVIDRVLAVRFEAPRSYTGEDIVEVHTHGGMLIARKCLELALSHGARIAQPGEFTRRAFINGRIDLSQAEGVLGVIKSRTDEALHASARTLTGELSRRLRKIHDDILSLQASLEIQLDFPEGETVSDDFDVLPELEGVISELEGVIAQCRAGMIFRDGVSVVIAGSPNAGKSSLLNALLGRNRAIVTDIPGTTRDIIEEGIIINGIPVRLSDTAGLRDTENVIEAEGVRLAERAVSESDICVYVIDSSRELTEREHDFIKNISTKIIIAFNKIDLPQVTRDIALPANKVYISAKNGLGIEELKHEIYNIASGNSVLSSGLNVSANQLEDLRESMASLNEARASLTDCRGEDITAGMLNSSRVSLLRVLGIDAGDEVLDEMFSRFCVGK